MPFNQSLWRIDTSLSRIPKSSLSSERNLEDHIAGEIGILDDSWMIIGRQVRTNRGFIDLLAIDATGALILIELKRDKTPRDVVAQALEYAAWVQMLQSEQIADIFANYSNGQSLSKGFRERFRQDLPEEDLNAAHQVVIVAGRLDDSTEEIVSYLADRGVAINVLLFEVFCDGEREYLSRAWYVDPAKTQETAHAPTRNEPWNNEFYVSFGVYPHRSWDDARKYGFVSGGGGSWYTKTLEMLEPGARVWVNVPKSGYVGVGVVEEPAVTIDDFVVTLDDGRKAEFLDAPRFALEPFTRAEYGDEAERVVRVKWLKTVSLEEAVKEPGFFGNQNTVCKPTTPKWPYTVERLKKRFGVE